MSFAVVLIAAGLAALLTAVLAGLLVLAERYLVTYGVCRIDVNAGARTIEREGGEPLLAALKAEGIFIPSACGGRGTCAYCKVRIVEGGGPVGPTELPLLTEQEVGDNVRISCQCKVRNDLRIVIPEELFLVREYRGVVERIRDLTHDIKELRIRLIAPQAIEFVPGQYVQLEAPAYGDNPEPVYRAYSISSPPSDDAHVELIVRLVPGGICTTWVFTMLREGDEVAFNGPYGEFRLSEDAAREMVWIAGGSGMAPFWSILRHMKESSIARKCTYFLGAVGRRDLFFVDELKRLADELPWFRFVPALSGQDAGEWDGQRGLITEVVDRNLTGGADTEAYLCGSAGMIDASIKVLRAKGIPEERIYYDKFN
ncbi:MAG TPA: FAD-binding oxidoreductase [Phycisphaerae bacterium]|nr:FAD-binding oxidoreductase [Phycisphaerae bacterium]